MSKETAVKNDEKRGKTSTGALGPGQRWSASRRQEVVLRPLRGEASEALSRELGVEVYRLEQWRDRALSGIDAALKERQTSDPHQVEYETALKRIGELSMENELLRARCRAQEGRGPLGRKKSPR
jgi:transposase